MKSTGAGSFALRLPKSTRYAAAEIATAEGISLNQFIVLAVVEKIVRSEAMTHDDSQSVPADSLKAS